MCQVLLLWHTLHFIPLSQSSTMLPHLSLGFPFNIWGWYELVLLCVSLFGRPSQHQNQWWHDDDEDVVDENDRPVAPVAPATKTLWCHLLKSGGRGVSWFHSSNHRRGHHHHRKHRQSEAYHLCTIMIPYIRHVGISYFSLKHFGNERKIFQNENLSEASYHRTKACTLLS